MGIDISGGMIVGANCSNVEGNVWDDENEGYLFEGEYLVKSFMSGTKNMVCKLTVSTTMQIQILRVLGFPT